MSLSFPGVVTAAVALLAALAQSEVSLWLIVPDSGRPGVLRAQGASALQDAGFDVGSLRTGTAPRVLVVYPRALADDAAVGTVLEMVREGAGLVVVYTLSADVAQRQNELLEPWGVELVPAQRGTGQTDVRPHPITRGVEKLFAWRMAASLRGVEALLVQGDNIIAGAVEGGAGRLVVLPLDAVVPGQESDAIPLPNLRLLVQAAQWAARFKEQPAAGRQAGADPQGPGDVQQARPEGEVEEPLQPELTVPSPGSRGKFSAVAMLDIAAADEGWPAIREAVVKLVSALGLKPQQVPQPGKPPSQAQAAAEKSEREPPNEELARLPLLRALQDDPALVVVGSCRDFADAEEVALAAYVESGGAALLLPRGTDKTNRRLVELNGVLAKFGMGALLGRPGGLPTLGASRILADVPAPKELPPGAIIIGHRGLDLVRVGDKSALRVLQSEAGRVAVADPVPLAVSKPEKAASEWWQSVLQAILRWLVEGMEFGQ